MRRCGNLVAVERDLVIAVDRLHVHVRAARSCSGSGVKIWPGFGIERGDEIRASLHLLDGGAEPAGDLREAALAEVFEVPLDDLVFEGAFLADAPQLDQQAIAQVARRRRPRGEMSGWSPRTRLMSSRAMPVFWAISSGDGLEKSQVVDVADDQFGDFLVRALEIAAVDLLEKVLLEGLVGDDGIEEKLAALLILLGSWPSRSSSAPCNRAIPRPAWQGARIPPRIPCPPAGDPRWRAR